jgi:hypothetical protein
VRVLPGGEACAGFVTVTVESERAVGSVADQRLSAHERRSPQELVARRRQNKSRSDPHPRQLAFRI